MSLLSKKISFRSLTVRYMLALVIIATLAVVAFISVSDLITTQKINAAVINVSGRQRMLSQKIALLTLHIVSNEEAREEDPEEQTALQKDLQSAIRLMEDSHELLTSAAEIDVESIGSRYVRVFGTEIDLKKSIIHSPAIEVMYFTEPWQADKKVRDFLLEAKAFLTDSPENLIYENPHLTYLLHAEMKNLLATLDAVVKQYQNESELSVAKLKNWELRILILMLAVLAAEALLIFRPMIRNIGLDMAYRKEAATEKSKLLKELKQKNQNLKEYSIRDGLTELYNHQHFQAALDRELKRVERYEGTQLSLIMLDVDHFKKFNDAYGHQTGDKALRTVARFIKLCERQTDVSARYGGEEFILILPETDLAGAKQLAERLRNKIAKHIFRIKDKKVSLTVSLGVSTYKPGKTKPQLISEADEALYSAKGKGERKGSGRNRVRVFI